MIPVTRETLSTEARSGVNKQQPEKRLVDFLNLFISSVSDAIRESPVSECVLWGRR